MGGALGEHLADSAGSLSPPMDQAYGARSLATKDSSDVTARHFVRPR